MDVNRAQAVSPAMNNGGKNNREQPHREDDEDGRGHDGPHDGAAFEIGGLAAEITPGVQQLLDRMGAELEPLRAQLKLAQEREEQLRYDLAHHAFLPVPGRREFLRELNHVLNHLKDLNTMPSLAILHVKNADEVRRTQGRSGLDRYLVHIAETVGRVLQPTDVLGNLGGNDFALILLGADAELARSRLGGIVRSVQATPLQGPAGAVTADLAMGVAELSPGMSAEAAILSADREVIAG